MRKTDAPVEAAVWPRRFGWLLMLLGAAVLMGWLFHIVELTRLVSNLRGMVFNTALGFVLLGFALRLPPQARPP